MPLETAVVLVAVVVFILCLAFGRILAPLVGLLTWLSVVALVFGGVAWLFMMMATWGSPNPMLVNRHQGYADACYTVALLGFAGTVYSLLLVGIVKLRTPRNQR